MPRGLDRHRIFNLFFINEDNDTSIKKHSLRARYLIDLVLDINLKLIKVEVT